MSMEQITEEQLKNMTPEQIAELQKQNCLFCKIVKGEIPSKKVYEDDKCVGILDINPASEGHVLVLPKEHFQIQPQIPEALIKHLYIIAKELSQSILKAFGVKGTTIFAANGAVAGQKAPHFMIHVFSRSEGDGLFENAELALGSGDLIKLKAHLKPKLYAMMGKEEPKQVEAPQKEFLADDMDENLIDDLSKKEKAEDMSDLDAMVGADTLQDDEDDEDEPFPDDDKRDDAGDDEKKDNGEDDSPPGHDDDLERPSPPNEPFDNDFDIDEKPDLDKISELFS